MESNVFHIELPPPDTTIAFALQLCALKTRYRAPAGLGPLIVMWHETFIVRGPPTFVRRQLPPPFKARSFVLRRESISLCLHEIASFVLRSGERKKSKAIIEAHKH